MTTPLSRTSLPSLPGLRIGSTSYILPDDILPNVRYLADLVEDVELVLFESDETSNLPSAQTVEELARIAGEKALTYTVHLPLDVPLGAADELARIRAVKKCLRVIQRMVPVAPFGWVLHFHHEDWRTGISPDSLPEWKRALRCSVRDLLRTGISPRCFCVETLSYPFEWVADLVADFDLGVCLDVGHLVLGGYDVQSALQRYGERIRIVHLHGVHEGVDHRDISFLDRSLVRRLLSFFAQTPCAERVLTLEIFNQQDLEVSLRVLKEIA